MSRFSVLARLVFLALLFILPPAGIGALLPWGWKSAIGGAGLGFGLFLWTGFSIERIVRRAVGAFRAPPQGLLRTLERSLERAPFPAPQLLVYEDPSPNALILRSLRSGRSWGGSGTLLVSQGLIQHLSEEELREVFKYSARLAIQPEALLRSYVAVAMCLLLRFAPDAWIKMVWAGRPGSRLRRRTDRLTPASFLEFILVLPWVRGLHRIAGGRSPRERDLEAWLKNRPELDSAVRKVQVQLTRWDYRPNPGLEPVFFCQTGSGTRLLSL